MGHYVGKSQVVLGHMMYIFLHELVLKDHVRIKEIRRNGCILALVPKQKLVIVILPSIIGTSALATTTL